MSYINLIFVPSPTSSGAVGAKVYRQDLFDEGSGFFVVNHGFNIEGDNPTVSVTVRDNNSEEIVPDGVNFTDGNSVTINLSSYRNPTLPEGYKVVIIG